MILRYIIIYKISKYLQNLWCIVKLQQNFWLYLTSNFAKINIQIRFASLTLEIDPCWTIIIKFQKICLQSSIKLWLRMKLYIERLLVQRIEQVPTSSVVGSWQFRYVSSDMTKIDKAPELQGNLTWLAISLLPSYYLQLQGAIGDDNRGHWLITNHTINFFFIVNHSFPASIMSVDGSTIRQVINFPCMR